jgi:hypothetical protein
MLKKVCRLLEIVIMEVFVKFGLKFINRIITLVVSLFSYLSFVLLIPCYEMFESKCSQFVLNSYVYEL